MLWRRPYLLLLLPPLFWAGNLLIGRAYAYELPPVGLAFWRWVVATGLLLPFVAVELVKMRRVLLTHWRVVVGCAVSGYVGYPLLNYVALHSTPAATASILNSTLPLLVPLFGWAIFATRPTPRALLGVVVSFCGVVWIVGRGQLDVLDSLAGSAGDLLVLIAVACFALYSVLLRLRPPEISELAFLGAMMLTTTVILLPAWAWESSSGRRMPVEPYAVISVLFVGLFASLLATIFWNHCIATLGPSLTGASFHLMPVYATVLAVVLLGEPVRVFHAVGIGLILIGFAIAVLPPRAATTQREDHRERPSVG